ncbi:MAG: hypothetical protein ACE5HD_07755 [Acidobacteriota bacterium]
MQKGSVWVVLALVLPLAVPATTTTTDSTASSSTRPPTNLKLVRGHWTPWDPPVPADGAQVYLIEKGDTLWDLAERDLNDPFLWPRIWDRNRYILDSHWIYPGDPLTLPGPVTVVADETTPPEVEPAESTEEEAAEIALLPPEEPSGRPGQKWMKPDPDSAADHSEMLCSGYILPERWESDLYLYAGEEEQKAGFATGDVMYANQGSDAGIAAGDRFFVVHQENKIKHPVDGNSLGRLVRRMATVEVIAVQGSTSTVEIVDGCDSVHLGYDLVPYTDLASPKRREIDLERYGVRDNGKTAGYVIYARDMRHAFGEGDIIYIDLGESDGIAAGDYMMIYRDEVTYPRPNEAGLFGWRPKHKSSIPAFQVRRLRSGREIPRKMLGELVVLASQDHTSTAKIMSSWREIYAGDQVQLVD